MFRSTPSTGVYCPGYEIIRRMLSGTKTYNFLLNVFTIKVEGGKQKDIEQRRRFILLNRIIIIDIFFWIKMDA